MQEWLEQLLQLRATRGGVTNKYIAEMLTKGCRAEGIPMPGGQVTENAVRIYTARTARG